MSFLSDGDGFFVCQRKICSGFTQRTALILQQRGYTTIHLTTWAMFQDLLKYISSYFDWASDQINSRRELHSEICCTRINLGCVNSTFQYLLRNIECHALMTRSSCWQKFLNRHEYQVGIELRAIWMVCRWIILHWHLHSSFEGINTTVFFRISTDTGK